MPELIRLIGYGLFTVGALIVFWAVFECLLHYIFPDDYGNDG